jgi:hypothetical protein
MKSPVTKTETRIFVTRNMNCVAYTSLATSRLQERWTYKEKPADLDPLLRMTRDHAEPRTLLGIRRSIRIKGVLRSWSASTRVTSDQKVLYTKTKVVTGER